MNNFVWSCKMHCGNTNHKKLCSVLPVITICLAKLFVQRGPWANERFCFNQHKSLYVNYIHYTFAHDIKFAIRALCRSKYFYMYVTDSDIAQHTQHKALLHFHCNSGYVNKPLYCHSYIHCLSCVYEITSYMIWIQCNVLCQINVKISSCTWKNIS